MTATLKEVKPRVLVKSQVLLIELKDEKYTPGGIEEAFKEELKPNNFKNGIIRMTKTEKPSDDNKLQ